MEKGKTIYVCVIDGDEIQTEYIVALSEKELMAKVYHGHVKENWSDLFGDEPIPKDWKQAIDHYYESADSTYFWWGKAEL